MAVLRQSSQLAGNNDPHDLGLGKVTVSCTYIVVVVVSTSEGVTPPSLLALT